MRPEDLATDRRNVRYLPYAFSERGAIMAAKSLTSARAVKMSVFGIRAFVKMRTALSDNREVSANWPRWS